jgi:Uma2 family endonuclease
VNRGGSIIFAAMTAAPQKQMTVDEFLTWAEGRPGRYELFRGEVVAMTPEMARHAQMKAAVYVALRDAIRARRLGCFMMPDGMTVRVDDTTAFEPDALVYCGEKLPPASLEVPNPVVVVEVLSHSTRRIDLNHKLAGYFRVASVRHYLVVDPEKPLIVHHARESDGSIRTQIVTDGTLPLDPPGIELSITDIYREAGA